MLANALCVIWCGRVCLFSVGLVVDFGGLPVVSGCVVVSEAQ